MRVEICCVGLCKMGVHQNSSSSVLDTLSSSNTHEPYQKTEITKHSGEQKAVSHQVFPRDSHRIQVF